MLVSLSPQGTFAFSLIKYTPLKYKSEYVYPWWGYAIGWLLALSSMVCIPLWMAYKLSSTQGSLREVRVVPYRALCDPSFGLLSLKAPLNLLLAYIVVLLCVSPAHPAAHHAE